LDHEARQERKENGGIQSAPAVQLFWFPADLADFADVTNQLDDWTMSAPAAQLFDWTTKRARSTRDIAE
jgi:xanthine dehydrogenase iron-sulfur cluster and FAD-binding subunit A